MEKEMEGQSVAFDVMSFVSADLPSMFLVFIFVLTVDKYVYSNNLERLGEKRQWHLPLISIIFGGLVHFFSNPIDYKTLKQFTDLIFEGMKDGAITSVLYSIIKKTFWKKISNLFPEQYIEEEK